MSSESNYGSALHTALLQQQQQQQSWAFARGWAACPLGRTPTHLRVSVLAQVLAQAELKLSAAQAELKLSAYQCLPKCLPKLALCVSVLAQAELLP